MQIYFSLICPGGLREEMKDLEKWLSLSVFMKFGEEWTVVEEYDRPQSVR